MSRRYWKDGIMGVITGDALGCSVQFFEREMIAERPVTTMIGHGTYDMPVCLYCYEQQKAGKIDDAKAIRLIHQISGLTHNHLRAKMACGLYFFMVRSILDARERSLLLENEDLTDLLQKGLDEGFAFYKQDLKNLTELTYYGRLVDLYAFRDLPEAEIKSSGYVVDTIETAVWSLLKTNTFRDALLTAVNLGEDTDTVGAICGGLAGLFYGYEDIPEDWLVVIQRREWIESLCEDLCLLG